MSSNFDPERWYDIPRDALERAFQEGHLEESAYERALEDLQQRLDTLWYQVDGSYRLPVDLS